eukprot:m.143046 g.143046  ORF g.143046 m.143046 type:complete len:469 (+) comp24203_c0_seq1:316-1722(+)
MRFASRVVVGTLVVGALLWFIKHQYQRAGVCPPGRKLCPHGGYVTRTAPSCDFSCVGNSLQIEVLWNCPLHSWTGVASEAVDFVVPLASLLPNFGVTGGFVEGFVKSFRESDQLKLHERRARGTEIRERHQRENFERETASIFVTQYDPNTYEADFERHNVASFDYSIGRVLFETSALPEGWVQKCRLLNEVWVPSKWQKEVCLKSGIEAKKIFVVPEGIDATAFNPRTVHRDQRLLPGSEGRYAFLSVGKLEDRKGFIPLLKAYFQEFTARESVSLHLRSGSQEEVEVLVSEVAASLGLSETPRVKYVPKVESMHDYAKLYATADAFVLATHGEGWGRPLMEAMASALPTIAPNWSGHTEFMDDDNSFLVPVHDFEQAFPNEYFIIGENFEDHKWASIDVGALRKIMRYVFKYRKVAQAVGRKARDSILKFSRPKVAQQVVNHFWRISKNLAARQEHQPNKHEKDLG